LHPAKKWWKASAAVVALLAVVVLAGCSSGGDSSSSTTTSAAPESVLVPNSQVTEGLATLRTAFTDANQAISSKSATAKTYPDKLNELWFAVEGRIKKNDPLSYVSFEDALAQMSNAAKDGRVADAQKALEKFTTTADGYLAKFP
jgi:hypothetical protein